MGGPPPARREGESAIGVGRAPRVFCGASCSESPAIVPAIAPL